MARIVPCVAVLLGLSASVFAPAASAESAAPVFEPDVIKSQGLSLDDGTWVDQGPGYSVRLKLLNEQQRLAYLNETTGYKIDPFGSRPDQPPRYLSFRLEIANASGGDLQFQAQNCWLSTNKNEHIYPLGIEGLKATYRSVELDMAPAYERAKPAVLESSRTLTTGEEISGLLVYRMFKPNTTKFSVDIQLTLSNGDLIRSTAAFRRVKEEKSKKKKKKKKGNDDP